jgi:hypothetical protein
MDDKTYDKLYAVSSCIILISLAGFIASSITWAAACDSRLSAPDWLRDICAVGTFAFLATFMVGIIFFAYVNRSYDIESHSQESEAAEKAKPKDRLSEFEYGFVESILELRSECRNLRSEIDKREERAKLSDSLLIENGILKNRCENMEDMMKALYGTKGEEGAQASGEGNNTEPIKNEYLTNKNLEKMKDLRKCEFELNDELVDGFFHKWENEAAIVEDRKGRCHLVEMNKVRFTDFLRDTVDKVFGR